MTTWRLPFQPVLDDYPNHLALAEPERMSLAPRWRLLLALVLLCVLLRTAMAWRITSVDPDGVLYIQMARMFEQGDFRAAAQKLSVNLYPLILAALHRAGLSWEMAAGVWGVGISSLVVLPLYGWVRRQFDDQVALVACLIYATQQKFIEWSPEIMRDPTFWFCWTLSIYLLWRAVTEVRLLWFLGAGVSILVACLTRFEGLFLLAPLALWPFWRWRALQTGRRRLVGGVLLCLGVFPAVLLMANLVSVSMHGVWTLPRLDPVGRIQPWLQAILGNSSGVPARGNPDIPDGVAPLSAGQMLWTFIPNATRGLSPLVALFMLSGLWGWRRNWARRDHQPLFYVAILILCGIWVQLWYDRMMCPRYMLPILLMASGFTALAVLSLCRRLLRWTKWFCWPRFWQQAASWTPVTALVVYGLIGAATCNRSYYESRQVARELGTWIHEHMGPQVDVLGPIGTTPVVCYYAQTDAFHMLRMEVSDDARILYAVETARPQVLLLCPTRMISFARCQGIMAQLHRFGMEVIRDPWLTERRTPLFAAVRVPGELRLSEQPVHTSRR